MPTMMRDAAISFPLLGSWSIDPSASFTLFGRTFYWYGVIIAVGFILAMLYCARHCRRCGIEPDTLYDFLIWMIPLAIIGARLYYVIFQWSDYRGHPIDALKIWEGGLAIYGGVIAGLLTGIVWCRKKKIPFGAMADVCAPGLLIGQCIGRWGNFINREAFGRETTAFSRMGLTLPGRETVYVHPTFLYESLWNFVGFLLLHFWFRRHERKFDGELILLYAVWYGIGRALIRRCRRARAVLHRQAPPPAALRRSRRGRAAGRINHLQFHISRRFFPMKDYHDMLNSLKNKVVDAAGKAGETVTNAANKVVSDEMRDKVAGAAHAMGDRAKYASRMTRMTVDCNAELERVKRTYTEIGRLYYENYRDTADAFLAELCQQVTDANARVAELEAQMDELRAAAKEYRPAPDLHTVDADVVEPEDIEVEVTEEPAPEE